METVHVLAFITTTHGKRQSVLDLIRAIENTVREEQGCIEYQVTIDHPDGLNFQTNIGEDSFVVVEKWASMDDLKAHAASEHMVEYGLKTKSVVEMRDIHILRSSC